VDIFGLDWRWLLLPVDPLFEDYDAVMGYTLPTRLDRERQLVEKAVHQPVGNLELPRCVEELLPV
jgi:hypothetical protein